MSHRITLFGRRWCGLCEEAKESLLNLQKTHPFELNEIDIDTSQNQRKYIRYTYDVPVIQLNGKEVMMHKVNVEKLKSLLLKS